MSKLTELAETLIRGWKFTVIPLKGKGDEPKTPAINWQGKEHRPLSLAQLSQMIEATGAQALGVVTGHLSGGLIVVDLDTEERLNEFRAAFDGLYNRTMRVNSARGKHIYFRLPYNVTMDNISIPGADLLSTGRYAVSPYSVINGHKYTREGASFPAEASRHEVELIQAWFESRKVKAEIAAIQDAPAAATKSSRVLIQTQDEARAYYLYSLESEGSRNQALFNTALKCRDSGQMQHWTAAVLVPLHVAADPITSHRNESERQRESEAVATIRSAYRRPARIHESIEPPGLPNNVREALHEERQNECDYGNQSPRYQTSALIVLDALRTEGVQPGMTFSFTSARKILAGKVSSWVIFHGIHYLRERAYIRVSSPRTPCYAANADDSNTLKNAECLDGQFHKKINEGKGRYEILYIMPGNLELCARIGIKYSRISDEISIEDCSKPSKYRAVLHAKFIDRKPAIHYPSFLSKRVGVCTRSIQRYNDREGVKIEAQYTATVITWSNVGFIPEQSENGYILRINGKDYPPVPAIAMRALKHKKEVLYCKRIQNFYYRNSLKPLYVPAPVTVQLAPERQPLQAPDQPPAPEMVQVQQKPLPAQEIAPKPADKPKRDRKQDRAYKNFGKRFRQPLTNPVLEALALRAQREINELEGKESLSLNMARRIAYYCEPSRVKQALKIAQTDRIESPVRYFVAASGYPAAINRVKEQMKIEEGNRIRAAIAKMSKKKDKPC